MPTPFPGMDPYLEQSGIWPDVHNALIAALRDDLGPRLRPRYFVSLETRVYKDALGDLGLVGRGDVTVRRTLEETCAGYEAGDSAVVVVSLPEPVLELFRETYLEVRVPSTGKVVTLIEILSPANKAQGRGRGEYLAKRDEVISSQTNLVEIDLLRAGDPMPFAGYDTPSDYRILIRRGANRLRADLMPFGVRGPIPRFRLPLLPGDDEPLVDLNAVLHALYDRAGYDLVLDYAAPPDPPLAPPDDAWAREVLQTKQAIPNPPGP
jgi:hypothetical protein